MPRQPVPIVPIPADDEKMKAMARRMAAQRQLRREQSQADETGMNLLITAAVVGALNDLTPSDPSPADLTGAGGDMGGAGASGDF